MTAKTATPMTKAKALSLVGHSTKEIMRQAWGHARKLESDRARLIEALQAIELIARVNAPLTDGSPMHKSILKLLHEVEGE